MTEPFSDQKYIICLVEESSTGNNLVGELLTGMGARVVEGQRILLKALKKGGPAHEPIIKKFGDLGAEDDLLFYKNLMITVAVDLDARADLRRILRLPLTKAVRFISKLGDPDILVINTDRFFASILHDQVDSVWISALNQEEAREALEDIVVGPQDTGKVFFIEHGDSIGKTWHQVSREWNRITSDLENN